MEGLFHTEDAVFRFRIDDRAAFDDFVGLVEEIYNADQLKDYLLEIQPKLLGRCSIAVEGLKEDIGGWLPVKKAYQYRKREAAIFCALVHCHPDNLRQVLSLFPSWYSEAVRRMILNGYISQTELAEIGAEEMIEADEDRYSWHRFQPGRYCSLFGVRSSVCVDSDKTNYWNREGYLLIPNLLTRAYARALLPELCQVSYFVKDNASYPVFEGEMAFHQSFPLIQGLQRQQQVAVTAKLKISAASAKKMQASTPEVIPESLRGFFKVNTGQYFLPGLLWAMQKNRKAPVDYAKAALERLSHAGPDQTYPAFLPHIKGFRANQFRYVPDVFWMEMLCDFLKKYSASWISLPQLSDWLHICGQGFALRSDVLQDLLLENTITGDTIRPDTQGVEIDMEILRAMAVCLFGWGMADLAVDPSDDVPDTPLGNVMQVRLTALGRYVLGLDKSYLPPERHAEGRFVLDTERLIIHSTGEDNPYERLLLDTADPIGRGRYRMSAESFLRHCKTAKDVEEKVKFFEDYIDGNPPEVWKAFFASLRRRSKPLIMVQEDYYLLRLDAKDTELIELMTATPAIRKLIILAEGYLFLVRKQDYPALVQLLKQYSYLL